VNTLGLGSDSRCECRFKNRDAGLLRFCNDCAFLHFGFLVLEIVERDRRGGGPCADPVLAAPPIAQLRGERTLALLAAQDFLDFLPADFAADSDSFRSWQVPIFLAAHVAQVGGAGFRRSLQGKPFECCLPELVDV
jgi:hypothetical protein